MTKVSEEKSKYYTVHVYCKNCNYGNPLQIIPLGTLISDHRCPNCGCKELDKRK